MNRDTIGKLAAPATAKIRQLQKIVQDIKKNDGSLLNKLRRLKSKPLPEVPVRDYRDENRHSDEQLSDSEYNNEMYKEPFQEQEDSYEPPPSHRVFTSSSVSFSRGEYLDSCRNRPERPPRKPLRPGKESKHLPPEPAPRETHEEDYISPDGSNDEDNYVEPAENPPANPGTNSWMSRSVLNTPLPELSTSPDSYEVPDKRNFLSLPANRLLPIPPTKSFSLPPKPSPRVTMRHLSDVPQPTGDDEYEVCDPNDRTSDKPADGPPPLLPKPLPKERSPKPPPRPRQDTRPREFERQTDRRSVSAENDPTDRDKDSDVYQKPWFASTCDRKTAEEILICSNKDGAFMVRNSSGHDARQPYTLVVLYKSRVYNIPIRYLETTQEYALGSEKRGEECFSSVSQIIATHQRTPLVLIDIQNNTKDTARLCFPVKP
ncbi:B-cell linker protein isoform 2-T2 [Aulostomus maculatus]